MDKLYQPLVSVVFTSFNHQEYLKQALDSLINQTYLNIEIIIIDDCSTDGSQEILKKYKKFNNVSLKLQNHNSGSYVLASNLGASFAKGEYLLFAQCDDFSEPNQIENLVLQFLNNPSVGVVFSQSVLVDDKSEFIANDFDLRDVNFKNYVLKNQIIKGEKFAEFLTTSCVIPNLSAALIRRDLYCEVKGLPINYKVASDWSFWLNLSNLTDFYYVLEPLNYFRQHSTTIRSKTKIYDQLIEIFDIFHNQIKKNGFKGKQKIRYFIGFGNIWTNYFIESPRMVLLSSIKLFFHVSSFYPFIFLYLIIGFFKKVESIIMNKL